MELLGPSAPTTPHRQPVRLSAKEVEEPRREGHNGNASVRPTSLNQSESTERSEESKGGSTLPFLPAHNGAVPIEVKRTLPLNDAHNSEEDLTQTAGSFTYSTNSKDNGSQAEQQQKAISTRASRSSFRKKSSIPLPQDTAPIARNDSISESLRSAKAALRKRAPKSSSFYNSTSARRNDTSARQQGLYHEGLPIISVMDHTETSNLVEMLETSDFQERNPYQVCDSVDGSASSNDSEIIISRHQERIQIRLQCLKQGAEANTSNRHIEPDGASSNDASRKSTSISNHINGLCPTSSQSGSGGFHIHSRKSKRGTTLHPTFTESLETENFLESSYTDRQMKGVSRDHPIDTHEERKEETGSRDHPTDSHEERKEETSTWSALGCTDDSEDNWYTRAKTKERLEDDEKESPTWNALGCASEPEWYTRVKSKEEYGDESSGRGNGATWAVLGCSDETAAEDWYSRARSKEGLDSGRGNGATWAVLGCSDETSENWYTRVKSKEELGDGGGMATWNVLGCGDDSSDNWYTRARNRELNRTGSSEPQSAECIENHSNSCRNEISTPGTSESICLKSDHDVLLTNMVHDEALHTEFIDFCIQPPQLTASHMKSINGSNDNDYAQSPNEPSTTRVNTDDLGVTLEPHPPSRSMKSPHINPRQQLFNQA